MSKKLEQNSDFWGEGGEHIVNGQSLNTVLYMIQVVAA